MSREYLRPVPPTHLILYNDGPLLRCTICPDDTSMIDDPTTANNVFLSGPPNVTPPAPLNGSLAIIRAIPVLEQIIMNSIISKLTVLKGYTLD